MIKKDQLESGLVFTDTSSFESKNFQFGQHALGRIEEFVKRSYIRVLIPDIINLEIEKHLVARLDESLSILKKVRKELVFLRNISGHPCEGLFSDVDKGEAIRLIADKFDRFRSHADVEIVSTKNVCSETVFERYFSEKPPFGGGGKKHEFPDAFALEAIREVAVNRSMPVYVISSDRDMEAYCVEFPKELIYLERIEDLVGLVNKYEQDLAKPAELALSAFLNIKAETEEALVFLFETMEYSCEDLETFDYEVGSIDILSAAIESYNVIDANANDAEVELTVNLKVKAVYSVTDYDSSPWDPEDKCYLYLNTHQVEKMHLEKVQVYLYFSYEGGLKSNARFDHMLLDDSVIELSFNRLA